MFRFVNLFRSILPVVPTECDVLIVCRQHNDKEWKFKEQHAKMWENITGAKDTLAPVVSTLRGERPVVPTPLGQWMSYSGRYDVDPTSTAGFSLCLVHAKHKLRPIVTDVAWSVCVCRSWP